MTLEDANTILRATDDMNGVEIALLTLIKDLQVRIAQRDLMPKLEGDK